MRIDLNTPVTLDLAKNVTSGFWRWWTGQLVALLPPSLKKAVLQHLSPAVVTVEGDRWTLVLAGATDGIALDMAAPPSVLRTLLERLAPRALSGGVSVRISPAEVLSRRIRVHVTAVAQLRSVVRLQLERLSPFPVETVQFDCRRLDGANSGEAEVEVAIVQLSVLKAYQAQLEQLGIAVTGITVGRFSFSPPNRAWTWHAKAQLALGLVAVAALGSMIMLAPQARERELAALASDIARLRGAAQHAESTHTEVERLRQPLLLLSAATRSAGALDTLAAVTQAIPRSTRLTGVTIADGTVMLEGDGPSADGVLAALRASGRFRTPHLAGPVEGARPQEHFAITAQALREAR